VLRRTRWQVDQEVGVQASMADAFDGTAPPSRPRFPTPATEPKPPGRKWFVLGDEDDVVSSNAVTGPEEPSVQQFPNEWRRRQLSMGILGHPALKAKQPLHVRLSRIDANRRDSARQRESEAWEGQITPKKEAPHADVVVALQQAFRKASVGSFNLPPPSEKDIQRHAVKDVEQMRSVFDLYDRDQSGTLDHMEMKGFLREVGLKATTQTERSEIQKMVALGPMEITFDEVVTRTVPIMRYIIVEVNRAHIKQMFTEADEDCSGLLTVKELKRILHIMGIIPSQQQINVARPQFV